MTGECKHVTTLLFFQNYKMNPEIIFVIITKIILRIVDGVSVRLWKVVGGWVRKLCSW